MSVSVNLEQFAAANKANVESLLTLANTVFASAERLAALNLNTARSVLEDGVANAKALLSAKDVQELLAVQSSFAQPGVEKAVAYSRSVYELATAQQAEATRLLESQAGFLARQSLEPGHEQQIGSHGHVPVEGRRLGQESDGALQPERILVQVPSLNGHGP